MYLIIVGGGKVGFYLAEELMESDHEVLVIEVDRDRVRELASPLNHNVIQGDGCEASTLDEAGVGRADVVIAVTGDDEDNLVVSEIAKYRGVSRCIARINNPRNEELFKRLGIETTVSATQAILGQIEQELPTDVSDAMIELFQLQGGLTLLEVRVPELSPVAGQAIKNVLLPQDSLIILAVKPTGDAVIPHGETTLESGDAVVIVTRAENRAQLREAIMGSTHGLDT